jgi:hypothetical protein
MRIITGGLKEIRDNGTAPPLSREEADAIDDAYRRAGIRQAKEKKIKIIIGLVVVALASLYFYITGSRIG